MDPTSKTVSEDIPAASINEESKMDVGKLENSGAAWDIGVEMLTSFEQLGLTENEGSKGIDLEKFEESPYRYIQELYAKRQVATPGLPITEWESKVLTALHQKYLERRVDKDNFPLAEISSLNDFDTVKLRKGQVVRFRCMIQDYLGPEYGVPSYSKTNPLTGEVTTGPTLLQDCTEINEEESIPTLTEKEIFVVVSPPGENYWVSGDKDSPKSQAVAEKKRAKLNDSDKEGEFVALPNYKDIVPSLFATNIGDAKPMACVLKVYKHDDFNWKHNDLLEVTGLIQLPTGGNEAENASAFDEISYPELGKLPVLHAFSVIKLVDGNPAVLSFDEKMFPLFKMSDFPVVQCAQDLRDVLALGLGGDRFAAVYAMIALVSRAEFVENQAFSSPLGKVVLNLSGISESSDILPLFVYVVKQLTARTVTLDFDQKSMSTMKLIPRKNMETNQLEPGILQLAIGTHMIINETGLQEGNFDEWGTRNIAALRELLVDQKVKYDYTYQYPAMEANCPTIIISKTQSVLPYDIRMEVKPDANLTLEDRRNRIDKILREKGDTLRNYLTMQRFIRLSNRVVDSADASLMEDLLGYFGHRNTSPMFKARMTAEDYSAFITSCRSWCLMYGKSCVDRETFMFWKEMDRIRDSRLPR